MRYSACEALEIIRLVEQSHLSVRLIRVWVQFDEDAQTADLLQQYEARIAALERLVGKQALELKFSKGALKSSPWPKSANTSAVVGPRVSALPKDAG
jgi:transposase